MAILKHYNEYRDFPKLGAKVGILIRGEQFFLLNDEEIWIELKISQGDKQALLKTLAREFMDVR